MQLLHMYISQEKLGANYFGFFFPNDSKFTSCLNRTQFRLNGVGHAVQYLYI
jgi:hypothetical protein